MSTNPNPLTLWEGIRLWIAGGEYAEKRVPELIASAIANHQDDNALVGVISDWLRVNFIDENHTALVFGVARLLKARGGRFFMAAAEALEALPDIGEELRRTPEMQNGTPEERRARLNAAVADRFKSTFQTAKDRLAHIPTALGGTTVSTPSSPSSSGGWFSGWGSTISTFLNGAGGALGTTVIAAGSALDVTIRFFGFWIAIAILYCMGIGIAVFVFPTWIGFIAKLTFVILVGTSAIAIAGFAFKHGGSILQSAVGAVLALIFSSMLVIAFVIATVAQIVMMLMTTGYSDEVGYSSWLMFIAAIVITIAWCRIGVGITQKLVALPGVGTKTIAALANDGVVDESEQRGIDLSQNITLIDISITVAGAISVMWVFLTFMQMSVFPIPFPLGVFLLTCEGLIVCAYMRMGSKLHRKTAVQDHLQPSAAKWSTAIYNGSLRAAAYIGAVGLLLVAGWFGVWWLGRSAEKAPEGNASRVTHIAEVGTSKALDYAEKAVGVPSTEEVREETVEAEAPQPKAQTKAEKYAQYCAEHPTDHSYPCDK